MFIHVYSADHKDHIIFVLSNLLNLLFVFKIGFTFCLNTPFSLRVLRTSLTCVNISCSFFSLYSAALCSPLGPFSSFVFILPAQPVSLSNTHPVSLTHAGLCIHLISSFRISLPPRVAGTHTVSDKRVWMQAYVRHTDDYFRGS